MPLFRRPEQRVRCRQPADLRQLRIAELRAMSVADLADIGLKPGDIAHVEGQIRQQA